MPDNKISLILGVICVLLLIGVIATYVVFNSKVVQLTSQKQNLISEKETLSSQKETLQADLDSAQATIESKDKEFSDYKDVLKDYFSMSKVITEDVQILATTITEWSAEQILIYDTHKRIKDKYESQLEVMKDHIDEYKEILETNKELFQELGFDIDKEINDLEKTVPLYEDVLDEMKVILAEIA